MSLLDQLVFLSRRAVSDADRRRASVHVLDWLGCIAAARSSAAGQAAAAFVGSDGLSGLWHPGCDAERAAFLGGALGNVLEMDDLHRASLLHVGDVVCPAAIAVALRRNLTGAQFLDAVLGGYEVAVRIGRAATASGYAPWYNSATCGVFGATFAAARAMDLSDLRTADALAQAGMQAAGVWQCRLDPGTGKQLATAQAARTGVASARLAAAGFTGPRRMLEGELGFFAVYYPQADIAQVTQGAESAFAIHDVSFKPWPACRHTHPAIAAALSHDAHPEIAEIEVDTYAAGLAFCDTPEPSSDHDARFSLQHCVAVALTTGAPGLCDFTGEARSHPRIKALRDRVTLREDPALTAAFPNRLGAYVTLRTKDGARHRKSTLIAPGDPEDPLSPAEIHEKASRNLRHGGVSPDAATDLIAACRALGDAPDLRELEHSLRAAFPSHRPQEGQHR